MARGTKSRRVPVLVGLLVLMGLLAWYLLSSPPAGETAAPGAEPKPPVATASSEPAKPAEVAPAAPVLQTGAPAAAPSTTATAAAPAEGQAVLPSAAPAAAPQSAAAPAAATAIATPPAAAMPAPATTPKSPAMPSAVAKPTADTAASAGGETSPELAQIQRLLAKLGYEPGTADGRMRAGTTRAIRLFERDVGLKVDGRPTKELLAFMRKLAGSK
jgi:hypothetical protein